jgi:hypothetical protein
MLRSWGWRVLVGLGCVLLLVVGAVVAARRPATLPGHPVPAGLHYAANSNFAADGSYPPGQFGFNLADVSTPDQLAALPPGVLGLVYLGLCTGADNNFTKLVDEFSGSRKLFGFYLLDEPYPATCPPANLESESTYIHKHIAGARTFLLEQNLSASTHPSYVGGYNPANTGIDFFGIDPYPCRTELTSCDPGMIDSYVTAAEQFGIPASSIIPVYQAFGGGAWVDDGGGSYRLPTAAEMKSMLVQWAKVIPAPLFDFVYSWGSQRADVALATAPPELQAVFAAHNAEQRTH